MEIKKMTKRKMEISVALMIHELKSTIMALSATYSSAFDEETEKTTGASDVYDLVWKTFKDKLYNRYKNGNKDVLWLIREMNEMDSFVGQLEKQEGYTEKDISDALK
tara:strand:- start:1282 stop:1602 length:321 start_codon:yes stop_codon:yes gene_type:complete